MSYNDDDLMQMQLNDPVLKRVINILCNTGHSFCLTSWPAELKIQKQTSFEIQRSQR